VHIWLNQRPILIGFLSTLARKIGAFTFRQIQSRKVHDNLVSAQLAHSLFRLLFLQDARDALRAF
jgi:hypothetical protein